MKRGLTNIAAHGVNHLAKRRLRACQQHTDLLAGFFANTGMTPRTGTGMTTRTPAFQPL
ncbi:hypothetical protein Ari01nite_41020 [Paractinoplanes rishiriensis]|uniref:Uncharacterized protein n=1 Tax=Paractinoplanes rishiriensis TaxID=1050105 RepID=A0A919N1D5_9ACTN|nr:hypothetical protein Ari01nite_41020 [Actinoplanes rishiriensis]